MEAIAFANFSKESRETSVQFFSFEFDNVVVKTLAFCLRLPIIHPRLSSFLTVFLFTAFSASFCISFPEISGNQENKSKNQEGGGDSIVFEYMSETDSSLPV